MTQARKLKLLRRLINETSLLTENGKAQMTFTTMILFSACFLFLWFFFLNCWRKFIKCAHPHVFCTDRDTVLPAKIVSGLTDRSLFWGSVVLCYCSRALGIRFHTRGGQRAASSSNQQAGHPLGLKVLTDSMVAKYYAYMVARKMISARQA